MSAGQRVNLRRNMQILFEENIKTFLQDTDNLDKKKDISLSWI